MFFAIINLLIFALICLLVILIIEWVAKMFGVPQNILNVIRAIFALIFLAYLLALVLGGPELAPPAWWWATPRRLP